MLRQKYPLLSAKIAVDAGLDQAILLDAVRCHNVAHQDPSDDALMLRTPIIYAGIAMPSFERLPGESIKNPSREFASMFSRHELSPVYGGLFLKINGQAPIGSILSFDTQEKAVVIKGPNQADIMSSTIRMLTNRNNVQLLRPGEKYLLNKTPMKLKGLSDHHQFAWNKFPPHVLWEK